jgi:phosphodiesterase/alkaline phosphatase D-like protein
MALNGNTLYVGGLFTRMGDQPQGSLAGLYTVLAETLDAGSITATSATLNGNATVNDTTATAVFQWGTESGVYPNTAAATPNPLGSTSPLAVSAGLTNLIPNTTYRYRLEVTTVSGMTYGLERIFNTGILAPAVTTLPATSVTTTSATLNATVNAHNLATTVTFEMSTTSGNYSGATAVSATPGTVTGEGSTAVSGSATGLTPGTTYYYRVMAANAAGITYGDEQSFTAGTMKVYLPLVVK